ncbi:MAG: DUF2093 domain-containing protein [Aestuariivirga sp.]
MNFIDPILPQSREARLKYLDGDYQVLKEGDFVRCAVTGDPIRLDELRYWSVERQEAYRSAEISFRRALEGPGSSDQK